MRKAIHKAIRAINLWDAVADRFNTHKSLDQIHPDAAANIYLGWPVFFEQIKIQCEYLGKDHCSVLDFGCGAGEFCQKLNMQGHRVMGMDCSKEMLHIAEASSPMEITYFNNSPDIKKGCEPYYNTMDVVTAIHVFDWIEKIDGIITELSKCLVDNGLIMFAVFPKKHVMESLSMKEFFEDFDSNDDPVKGVCNFDGVKIPVFIKEASHYDKLFEKLNFEKVLEYYPPFPKTFFDQYKWTGAKYPEMMILAYRKNLVIDKEVSSIA
jgi:predicted TPR repeat methyltransferase